MSAKRKGLSTDLGATFDLNVRVKDEAGAAVDLTGYSATFNLYDEGKRTAYFTKTVEPGIDGWVNIHASDEETEEWECKSVYTLEIEAPNGDKTRLLYGPLTGVSPFYG